MGGSSARPARVAGGVATFAAGALACGFAALAGVGTAGAEPTPRTFSFEGASEQFTVPVNVCQVTVDALGAQGGAGFSAAVDGAPGSSGLGGHAVATVTVTPGETLTVIVGGAGGAGSLDSGGMAGFNGGASGGTGANAGGGGGGMSNVGRGATALVVAGAGGGGGGAETSGDGGAGGGPGTNGGDAGSGAGGGKSGGNGGAEGTGGNVAGSPGGPGSGGAGATAVDSGGGGGGGATGGGGGAANQAPVVHGGGGGGGGSGSGPAGTTFENGVRSGDGLITIAFDPATDSCSRPGPTPTTPATPIAAAPRFTG